MAKRDFYDVLGVAKGCDDKELKSAFRKLAMQLHPDRNGGDRSAEVKFKEVNEAYEILKDPQKRAAYDRFGHQAFEHGGGFGAGAGAASGFASFADIFDEFFGDFRGGGRRGSGRERGSDLRYNLEVTLEEAYAGKSVEVEVPTTVTCSLCSGTGSKPGSSPKTCVTCHGAGRVRASQGGFFHIERTCPTCHGRGEVVSDPCTKCSGAGRVSETRTLSVNIPSGIEDGTRIRLAGEGEAGVRGGPAGDLYIFLSIKPHAFFQRDGADIFCRVPISLTTAALGGQFEVPTLDGGRSKVKVPEGTQGGQQIHLRGKGMPVLRSRQVGDMYVQIVVETPRNLSRKQREILEEFERVSDEKNNPESSGFFTRVKDFFDNLSEK
jgi:molecular chaperone DnaJ